MKPKLLLLILLLLFTAIVNAKSSDFDPRVDDWYKVEDWEIEVCSKWGGTEESQQGATSTEDIALSQITLTLQAKKIEYPEGPDIYTVSYYIEPIDKKFYSVWLSKGSKKHMIVNEEKIAYGSPAADYKSLELEEKYDKAHISYGKNKNEAENIITVPIINATALK